MRLFDSHLHLNSPAFAGREEEAWRQANQAGVDRGTVVGYDLPSSRRAIELAQTLPGIYATVGVSPHDYQQAPDDYINQLNELAQAPEVCAIGEAGLEYHYPAGPPEFQHEHFLRQIELARRLDKTLVVHLRDADQDMMTLLDRHQPGRLIFHCYTGSLPLMQKAVDLGHFISFAGIVTFKNAKAIQQVAAATPLEHLLVETDAPYLAPTPHRGKPCEPYMIADTAKHVAKLRGMDLEKFAEQIFHNAHRAFGVPA